MLEVGNQRLFEYVFAAFIKAKQKSLNSELLIFKAFQWKCMAHDFSSDGQNIVFVYFITKGC